MGLTLAATLASSCTCAEPPAAPATTSVHPPEPVLPIAAPRSVASTIAFDLVHTPGGAVLAWGTPARQGGGVRALALDPLGGPRGTEVEVVRHDVARSGSAEEVRTQIEELSLASSGTRLGLAWVVRTPDPIVQATFSSQELEGFAPARTLAPSVSLVPGSRAARGRIAVSNREDGALLVLHRLEDARCSAAIAAEAGTRVATCARIGRSELDAVVGELAPAIEAEVPSPCAALLPGAVTSAGTWFHGICHQAPELATTLYAIRPSISYAAAHDTLPGCTPEAIAPLTEGAAVVGRCEDALAVAFVDGAGRETLRLAAPALDVVCEAGRPVIAVGSGEASRRVPLAAAVSRIEGLLPERLAPRGARATWTGTALLVAAPLADEVALRRYECRDASLVRTDLP